MRQARPSNPAPRITICLFPRETAARTAASMVDVRSAIKSADTRARPSLAVSRLLRTCSSIFASRFSPFSLRNTRAVGSRKSCTCDAPTSATARAYVTMSAVLLERSAFIRSCVRRSQRLYRLLVVLAFEIFLNELVENAAARDARKQGGGRAQLHVIRSSKNLESRASGDVVYGRRALLQSRAQNGMIEIRARLSGALDRILTRHWAKPETHYLRKDVPHPV